MTPLPKRDGPWGFADLCAIRDTGCTTRQGILAALRRTLVDLRSARQDGRTEARIRAAERVVGRLERGDRVPTETDPRDARIANLVERVDYLETALRDLLEAAFSICYGCGKIATKTSGGGYHWCDNCAVSTDTPLASLEAVARAREVLG